MTGIGSLEAEENHPDARMLFIALNVLEQMNRLGWVEDCPAVLLTEAERKFLRKMQRAGLADLSDEALTMALIYAVAGVKSLGYKCEVDLARRLNDFRSQ